MTSKSRAPNVASLFQAAQSAGTLSPGAAQIVNVPDLGVQVQAGLGVNIDDVTASEVVLVTMLIDDSGSITSNNNAQVVREGHNAVLDALNASKQKDGILCHTVYLNGEIICPYVQLSNAVRLTKENYNPRLGTPLYDGVVATLATVLAKTQEFADNGIPCRAVTLFVTDGADYGSRKYGAAECKKVIKDLLKTETSVIAAMGIEDGSTDFRAVFEEIGIPKEWVLVPGNTHSQIRRAFQVFSQSAVQVSQTPGNVSQLGGFGTP